MMYVCRLSSRNWVYGMMIALAAPLALQGCGSSSATSTTATCSASVTSIQGGICAAQAAMAAAPRFSDASPTAFNFLPRFYHRATYDLAQILFPAALASGSGITSFWTNSSDDFDLYGNNTSESPMNWMGQEMDSGFTNYKGAPTTPFGRSDQDMFTACVIGAMTAQDFPSDMDTDNLLKTGTYTMSSFTLPNPMPSVYQGCSVPSTLQANMAGMTMGGTLTVSTPSGAGSEFTKVYAMPNGMGTSYYYLKLDPTNEILHYAIVEKNNPGTGQHGWAIDRQYLSVSGSVTDFEYISQTYCNNSTDDTGSGCATATTSLNNFTEQYRFHIDTANSKAYVYGSYGGYDDAMTAGDSGSAGHENFMRYAMAGNPNNLKSVAISLAIVAPMSTTVGASASVTPTFSGNACISASDGSIQTDDSLNCDVTGVDITGLQGTTNGATEKTIIAHASTSATYTQTYSLDSTTAIGWTTEDTTPSTSMFYVASP